MLTRRVTLKPRYDLLGLPKELKYQLGFQAPSEIAILTIRSQAEALQDEHPMSYINEANTHWIAYYWRNLPQPELERIMQEDGLALDVIRSRYNLGAL